MTSPDPHRARRLELVLQQTESLPTLPALAMRLLQLTGDDDSNARQVIELIRSDPALTARVLAMCRTADRGAGNVTSLDRAVVLLGFSAIRSAVLSLKIFEMFDEGGPAAPRDGHGHTASGRFDRAGFWRHSLAVAVLSEMIVKAHADLLRPFTAAEAFVCGLLHDVGKLALEHLLPKSYQRVIELTEQHRLNIADVERKVVGLDHNTIGKRLAEHWQLPHLIQDCIWLHGSPHNAIPPLAHRPVIGIVTVADLAVRQQHIGYSGNHHAGDSLDERCREVRLDAMKVRASVEKLHDELERRAAAMGLPSADEQPSGKAMLESVMQANATLGRANQQLEAGSRLAATQKQTLEAIVEFHRLSSRPGRGMQDVLRAVVGSAAAVLGQGYFALLYQPAENQPWLLSQYAAGGRAIASDLLDPPPGTPTLSRFTPTENLSMQMASLLPWVGQHVSRSVDVAKLSLLALPCGWGTAAVLLHEADSAALPPADQLAALLHTWGAAIAATAQHLGARRLGEQLVQTSRELMEAQETLLRNQSMARLGEMAAGAAHEMNNPLAVISGRAQLLVSRLPGDREQADAQQIAQQAQKLSDLISGLRMFADPPRPRFAVTTAADVLKHAMAIVAEREPSAAVPKVTGFDSAAPLRTDGQHLAAAFAELLINAAQAKPRGMIHAIATVDPINDRFLLKVIDDGVGMDANTLQHACDPFFSAKPAGRQIGLGLAKAKRLMEGLGGDITLTSAPGEGTTATLSIPTPDAPPPEVPKRRTPPVELAQELDDTISQVQGIEK